MKMRTIALVTVFALLSTFALAEENPATGAQGGATGVPGVKTNPTPEQATQGGTTGVPGVKLNRRQIKPRQQPTRVETLPANPLASLQLRKEDDKVSPNRATGRRPRIGRLAYEHRSNAECQSSSDPRRRRSRQQAGWNRELWGRPLRVVKIDQRINGPPSALFLPTVKVPLVQNDRLSASGDWTLTYPIQPWRRVRCAKDGILGMISTRPNSASDVDARRFGDPVRCFTLKRIGL